MTICLDVAWNGSELSTVNVVGAVVCILGIACHVYRKATDKEMSLGKGRRMKER